MASSNTAPGAVASLVCGICAILFWPLAIVLGPIAIVQGGTAMRAIDEDDELVGFDLAKAGWVLGWIATVLVVLAVLVVGLLLLIGLSGGSSFTYKTF